MAEKNLHTEYDLYLYSDGKFYSRGAPDAPVTICETDFDLGPPQLAAHAYDMGFTHVLLSSPGGAYLEAIHERGIGVIADAPDADGILAGAAPSRSAFRYQWNMRWTEETLAYLSEDPLFRSHHHRRLLSVETGSFVLPLSREFGSLAARMPGDEWQKFANLRLLYGYQAACPGKKLIFPGDEFHNAGLARWVRDLNTFYRAQPALFERDSDPEAFEWVDTADSQRSILAFRRNGRAPGEHVLFIFNFTPVPRRNYRAGVPSRGEWKELLNSDATLYGGSGQGNLGGVESAPVPAHGCPDSLNLTLPPLAMLAFRKAGEAGA